MWLTLHSNGQCCFGQSVSMSAVRWCFRNIIEVMSLLCSKLSNNTRSHSKSKRQNSDHSLPGPMWLALPTATLNLSGLGWDPEFAEPEAYTMGKGRKGEEGMGSSLRERIQIMNIKLGTELNVNLEWENKSQQFNAGPFLLISFQATDLTRLRRNASRLRPGSTTPPRTQNHSWNSTQEQQFRQVLLALR